MDLVPVKTISFDPGKGRDFIRGFNGEDTIVLDGQESAFLKLWDETNYYDTGYG